MIYVYVPGCKDGMKFKGFLTKKGMPEFSLFFEKASIQEACKTHKPSLVVIFGEEKIGISAMRMPAYEKLRTMQPAATEVYFIKMIRKAKELVMPAQEPVKTTETAPLLDVEGVNNLSLAALEGLYEKYEMLLDSKKLGAKIFIGPKDKCPENAHYFTPLELFNLCQIMGTGNATLTSITERTQFAKAAPSIATSNKDPN